MNTLEMNTVNKVRLNVVGANVIGGNGENANVVKNSFKTTIMMLGQMIEQLLLK